jgi:hypothetical protein
MQDKEYHIESICLTEQLNYMGTTMSAILFREEKNFVCDHNKIQDTYQRTTVNNRTEANKFSTVNHLLFKTRYLMFEKTSC